MKRFSDHLRMRYCGPLRQRLALLRLLLLFTLACFLVIETGIMVRITPATDQDLAEPRPVLHGPGTQLPFLGITVALEQYASGERRAALVRLPQSGFGWVRQRFDWGQIEPQPGQYDWRRSDAILQDIVAAGLVPVIVLDGSPAWARAPMDTGVTDNPLAPPADPTTFARFAATFAARYQESTRFYQIWDEPNLAPHWGNRLIEPVGYAQLLKAAATAIRAVDPDAVMITAALAPTGDRGHLAIDEVYFLQRLYAAGGAPFFDAVAAQPLGFGAAPDDIGARLDLLNFQRVKLLRRTMIAAGDGETPIWAVRYGWNIRPDSPWRTVQPADQITFATAALTLARQQWPWLTAMGWAIDQPAAPPDDPQWGFALTTELAAAFHTWQTNPTAAIRLATAQPSVHWHWAGLLVLWLLVGWRTVAALHLLPWTQWHQEYAAWPVWQKIVGWVALALLYTFATWPPLLVICWLIAVLFLLSNPTVGLGLVALVLPFYFQHKELALAGSVIKIPPAHAMLGCLWLALLIRTYRRWDRKPVPATGPHNLGSIRRFIRHRLDWLALLWVIISLLTSVNVWQWPAYGQGLLNLVFLPVLAYLATRWLVTTPLRQTIVIVALLGGGVLVAFTGLLLWWQGEGTLADGVLRLVGPYYSPNHTALYLERAWWIGLGVALQHPGGRQRWLLLACGVIGVALLLTVSRGAWLLGMPAGALVFGWTAGLFQRPRLATLYGLPRRTVLIGMGVALGLFIVLVLASLGLVWDRLTNSATVVERLTIWQATLHLWQDHWLLGVGPGGFFWSYPRYLPWSAQSDPNLLHPHNLWLELLAGWGIIGLLWFLLFFWQVGQMRNEANAEEKGQPSWQSAGLFAALAAGIAHGQVDTFAALPDLAVCNWLVLGLLVTMQAKRSARPPARQ